MKLRLYGYWRSSCSWRVRIALAYKGLAYEHVAVHLLQAGGEQHRAEYTAKNPLAQVPLLEVETTDGARRVAQSLAIIELLEDLHPEPALLPREPFARARARQLAEMINAGIQPLQNLGVMKHVKSLGADPHVWARHFIARGLVALEAEAAATAGRFLVGDAPTVADLCLVPQLYNARRNDVDVAPFPTLLRVEAACATLPAFEAAHADRQPDAPPPEER